MVEISRDQMIANAALKDKKPNNDAPVNWY